MPSRLAQTKGSTFSQQYLHSALFSKRFASSIVYIHFDLRVLFDSRLSPLFITLKLCHSVVLMVPCWAPRLEICRRVVIIASAPPRETGAGKGGQEETKCLHIVIIYLQSQAQPLMCNVLFLKRAWKHDHTVSPWPVNSCRGKHGDLVPQQPIYLC